MRTTVAPLVLQWSSVRGIGEGRGVVVQDDGEDCGVTAAEVAVMAPALGRTTDGCGELQVELLARPTIADLATVGIWCVHGPERDWSLVCKVIRHAGGAGTTWRSHSDPDHPFYWRREAEAFGSDLLAGLRDGLRAPACHGIVDRADGTTAIWMEDVAGLPASHWSLDRYRRAARDLGRMQGRLADAPALVERWLSRDWLRVYVERRSAHCEILDDPRAWSHPGVEAVVPAGRAGAFRQLWADRHRFRSVLDNYPRTLCQLDFHPGNLFDVDGDTVVIDWAFAGVGALGEDAGTLLVDTVADFRLEPTLLPDLFENLVDGYAAGLADGGCVRPVDDVRRAIAAGATAKYGWLVPAVLSAFQQGRTTMNGRPIEEGARAWVAVAEFLVTEAPDGL
ncbi:phosphotransferase [Actinopolymorpha sp. B9G3]|uniref:phosphotransferase n=1 Tax=Actinopolymorpha sp. B9G3 TaxID=3158970 RepID=UPI0032D8BC98